MKHIICVGKIKEGKKEINFMPMFDRDLQNMKGGTKDENRNFAKGNI